MRKGIIIMALLSATFLVGCGSEDKEKIAKLEGEIEVQQKTIKDYEKEVKDLEAKLKVAEKKESTTEEVEKKDDAQEKEGVENNIEYKSYENSRFGFSFKYPNLLLKGGDSTNMDGAEFKDRDGDVTLVASGTNNVLLETASSLYESTTSGKNVAYKNIGNDFFVASWAEGNTIKYEYRKVGEGSIQGFVISYPKDKADTYDKLVSEIYNSFKAGDVSMSF